MPELHEKRFKGPFFFTRIKFWKKLLNLALWMEQQSKTWKELLRIKETANDRLRDRKQLTLVMSEQSLVHRIIGVRPNT